jgi:hypothetical protein
MKLLPLGRKRRSHRAKTCSGGASNGIGVSQNAQIRPLGVDDVTDKKRPAYSEDQAE